MNQGEPWKACWQCCQRRGCAQSPAPHSPHILKSNDISHPSASLYYGMPDCHRVVLQQSYCIREGGMEVDQSTVCGGEFTSILAPNQLSRQPCTQCHMLNQQWFFVSRTTMRQFHFSRKNSTPGQIISPQPRIICIIRVTVSDQQG